MAAFYITSLQITTWRWRRSPPMQRRARRSLDSWKRLTGTLPAPASTYATIWYSLSLSLSLSLCLPVCVLEFVASSKFSLTRSVDNAHPTVRRPSLLQPQLLLEQYPSVCATAARPREIHGFYPSGSFATLCCACSHARNHYGPQREEEVPASVS